MDAVMTKGCPYCRAPLGWVWVWYPFWTRWRCAHCDALLGIKPNPRLVLVGTMMVVWAATLLVLRPTSTDERLLVGSVLLVMTIVLVYAIDSPRLIEAHGFRCQQCGYDLRGQTLPRCPECGTEFDAEERARILAREDVHTKRPTSGVWTLVFIAVVIVLLGFQVLGFVMLRRSRANRTAGPVATQPAARGTSSPSSE